MKKEVKPARCGDLVAVQIAELMQQGDEVELGRCFYTLGHVTITTADGTVTAYRRFGGHFVDREVPKLCRGVGAHRINMLAVENDMLARLARDTKANEFADLDVLNAYLLAFMKEVR